MKIFIPLLVITCFTISLSFADENKRNLNDLEELGKKADASYYKNDSESAATHYQEYLSILGSKDWEKSFSKDRQEEIILRMNRLAISLERLGDLKESDIYFRKTIDAYNRWCNNSKTDEILTEIYTAYLPVLQSLKFGVKAKDLSNQIEVYRKSHPIGVD